MAEKTIQTNVNERFDQEISLWKLIGQKSTIEILQRTILCYQNDLSENRKPRLPSILICSDERGLGSETLSRSMTSSLAMPIKTTFGDSLRFDVNVQEFLQDSSDETAFYISNAEKISSNIQQVIYRIMKDKMLRLAGRYGQVPQYVPFDNRLIILGTTNEISLASSLRRLFDLRISLTLFDDELLFNILRQRVNLLCWKTSDDVLNHIVLHSQGNPSKAIRTILQTAYVVMRSEGKDIIEEEHVNKSLKLNTPEAF